MADIHYLNIPEKSTLSVDGDFVIITDSQDGEKVKRQSATKFRWQKWEQWDKWEQGEQWIPWIQWPQGLKWEKWEPFRYSDFTSEQLAGLKWPKWDRGEAWPTWPQWPQGLQWPIWPTWPQGEKWEPFRYSDFTAEQLSALKWPKWDKWEPWRDGTGTWDMLKSEYDADGDNKVDIAKNAEQLGGSPSSDYAKKTDIEELQKALNEKSNINHTHIFNKNDVWLGNVDNTSDINKPISAAVQNALAGKAADSSVVHKTGNESIGGEKTFSNNTFFSGNVVVRGVSIAPYTDNPTTIYTIGANEIQLWGHNDVGRFFVYNTNGGGTFEILNDKFTLNKPLDLFRADGTTSIGMWNWWVGWRCAYENLIATWADWSQMKWTLYSDRDGSIIGTDQFGIWAYPINSSWTILAHKQAMSMNINRSNWEISVNFPTTTPKKFFIWSISLNNIIKSQFTRINSQTETSYTLALWDAWSMVTCNNASAITVTVPPNSSVAFPIGTQIDCAQLGAGKVTFAQWAGVTISSKGWNKSIWAQYVGVSLKKIGTDTWFLFGDLIA